MGNDENKKMSKGKKIILWILGIFLVIVVISSLSVDDTDTNNETVNNNISESNSEEYVFNIESVKLGEHSPTERINFSTNAVMQMAEDHVAKFYPNASISYINILESDGYGRYSIMTKFQKSGDSTYSYSKIIVEIAVDETKEFNVGNTLIYYNDYNDGKSKSNWGTPIN